MDDCIIVGKKEKKMLLFFLYFYFIWHVSDFLRVDVLW